MTAAVIRCSRGRRENAAGVADPRPERGQGDERADDAVRPPGEQRSDHPGQAGGEQRRLPRQGEVEELARLAVAAL